MNRESNWRSSSDEKTLLQSLKKYLIISTRAPCIVAGLSFFILDTLTSLWITGESYFLHKCVGGCMCMTMFKGTF